MKKIVSLGLAAALASGMVFAAEPVANLSVVEFTGNASVEWGVDLDAGKTGFNNGTWARTRVKLFDAGSKATEKENDVWAELVLKIDDADSCGPNGFEATDSAAWAQKQNKPYIDVAKLHFNNFYVGIKSGDTTTGSYYFDGAIRSARSYNGNDQWLYEVGPAGYTQGIVAGYDDSNLGVDVDFRSKPDGSNRYTDNYALAAEAKLKDGNEWVNGLFVDVGGSLNISDCYFTAAAAESKSVNGADAGKAVLFNKMTKDFTGYEKVTVNGIDRVINSTVTVEKLKTIGYSANAGYKFNIDEKLWVKPAVGFTGTTTTGSVELGGKTATGTANESSIVFGAILGWGTTADANAGVYFLDDAMAKKVTPGVSVVAGIPLAETGKLTYDGNTWNVTSNNAVKAIIVPSFYLGSDLIPGLKAAAYSEMAVLDYVKPEDRSTTTGRDTVKKGSAKNEGDTFAMAIAAGVAYDIKVDAVTVTPKAGFRFANRTYVDNSINSIAPLSSNKVFDGMGYQDNVDSDSKKATGSKAGDYFNLKIGCDVAGLINNTTFYVNYVSGNLANVIDYSKIDKESTFYNTKAGTLNVGTKISF